MKVINGKRVIPEERDKNKENRRISILNTNRI
jgi:hypothetical protein